MLYQDLASNENPVTWRPVTDSALNESEGGAYVYNAHISKSTKMVQCWSTRDMTQKYGSVIRSGLTKIPTKRDNQVIAICGVSGSGKSSLSKKIMKEVGDGCVLIPCDSFYKALTPKQHAQADDGEWDFDDPNAIDWKLYDQCLTAVKRTMGYVRLPVYSFGAHQRVHKMIVSDDIIDSFQDLPGDCVGGQVIDCSKTTLIVTEGILLMLCPAQTIEKMDYKVFVDMDTHRALVLRMLRDIRERERTVEDSCRQYLKHVYPSSLKVIKSRCNADMFMSNDYDPFTKKGGMPPSAIDTLVNMALEMTRTDKASTQTTRPNSPPPTCTSQSMITGGTTLGAFMGGLSASGQPASHKEPCTTFSKNMSGSSR